MRRNEGLSTSNCVIPLTNPSPATASVTVSPARTLTGDVATLTSLPLPRPTQRGFNCTAPAVVTTRFPYTRPLSTPWDWSSVPVPQNQLANIQRVALAVTAASSRPDARGTFAQTDRKRQRLD